MTTINHGSGNAQRAQLLPEDRRLELSRASEERSRPVAVRVYVSPTTSRAALHWVNAEGGDSPSLWDPVPLVGTHAHALRDEVLNLAGAVLAERGFNYARGAYWRPVSGERGTARPATAEVAVVATRAYLDLQARRFGPVPELPEVPGVTFTTTQRGQWSATVPDGRTFLLTWTPHLDGDRWTVWGGDQNSDLIRPATTSMAKALFVLRHPSHARH
ncbi:MULTISPECIES: hypothetical protein [unclassified Streptomyces]|uniref:hypothetical protein n=1 Tax=unclassified Streptomyces TaxID=2593676 RepID=UPI00340239CB